MMRSIAVPVPTAFAAYADAAVVRLRYLYPEVTWCVDPGTGNLYAEYEPEAHSDKTLIQEACFQLYREKIHEDTLHVRRKIYEAI